LFSDSKPHRRLKVLKDTYCGELRLEHVTHEVTLAGWVHRRRDHGGLIFLDLRDSTGLVQVVVNPQTAPEAHAAASQVRNEFVIQVKGAVDARRPGTENKNLPTGAVEVAAAELSVLNAAKTPRFYI
jgi:aspartyl-tRNA synthetase